VRHQSAYSKSAQPNGHHIPQSSTPFQTTPLTASQNGCPTSDSSSHNPSTNSLSGTTPLSTLRSSDDPWSTAEQRYLKGLDLVPGLKRLLGFKGKMVRGEGEVSTVRTASDYSYSASSYAGENYRIVGDAAGKFLLYQ
jgi:hypothetical protein